MSKLDKTVIGITVCTFLIGAMLGGFLTNHFNPCRELPTEKVVTDIVVVHDTIRLPVPTPIDKGVAKVETVKPKIKPVDDTKKEKGKELLTDIKKGQDDAPTLTEEGNLEIPIERKEYITEDYKAIVEGWRPSLVSMEVYRKTTTVTNTITKLKTPRFSVIVGPSVGYDGKEVRPNIGITAGFVLWSK